MIWIMIFFFFLMSCSPRAPSHMGQTDPVTVFPSQQPIRKDPSGCSGVGCTGNGNPDDPINILTLPTTEYLWHLSLSLSESVVFLVNMINPSNRNTQREKPMVSVTFLKVKFKEHSVIIPLKWKIIQNLNICQCFRSACSSVIWYLVVTC